MAQDARRTLKLDCKGDYSTASQLSGRIQNWTEGQHRRFVSDEIVARLLRRLSSLLNSAKKHLAEMGRTGA